MRVIARKAINQWRMEHPKADRALLRWLATVEDAAWTCFADIGVTFGKNNVDQTNDVKSNKTVVIFDIGGNKFRLIAAVHYVAEQPEKGRVYAMRFLKHAEYDKNTWKGQL